jgi:hypothetical protein
VTSGRKNDYRLGSSDPVMLFELAVSSWCNYRCSYCVTPVHAHRGDAHHAFDYHPVEAWVRAFDRVPRDFALVCRGGEPFLDHASFARFLAAVGAMPRLLYLRVDTNGSWDPAHYEAVPRDVRRRAELNVSFHPTQIALDRFEHRLGRILDAGWNVAMVNYVMEASQAGGFAEARDRLGARYGVYVNPNPDAFDAAWASPSKSVRDEAQRALGRLLPAVDVVRKTGTPTRGKPCFFPSIAYFVGADGVAMRACNARLNGDPRRLDFIARSDEVEVSASPVACVQPSCVCLDRYAFLEEHRERGRSLDLLGEYVAACRRHGQATTEAARGGDDGLWGRIAALATRATLLGRRRDAGGAEPSGPGGSVTRAGDGGVGETATGGDAGRDGGDGR